MSNSDANSIITWPGLPSHSPNTRIRRDRSSQTASADCYNCLFKPHCLPAEIDGERLTRFARGVLRSRRPVKAGDVLVRQGDAMNALYTLRAGSLKAVFDEANGYERVLGFRFPGAVIGLAEPGNAVWTRTFIALEDTWLCHIPLPVIGDDALQRQLIRLVSERLRSEYETHLMLAVNDGSRKVMTFIVEMSARFAERGLSAHRFHLPMHYMDIASYLGMRHESVSRTLTKLQDRGLLHRKGRHIVIPDLDALRRFKDD
ncbi:MAG: helix-turn-helix domain-containing protein [Salinisphaera sp.]|jgi:CRP/FNR family transcriptional regulator|nr:helix-turn-helix domain-containing protein [Salinisphaera sp.]